MDQPPTPEWVHRLRCVGHMRSRRLLRTWSPTIVAETDEAEIFVAEAITPTADGAQAITEVLLWALMAYAGGGG